MLVKRARIMEYKNIISVIEIAAWLIIFGVVECRGIQDSDYGREENILFPSRFTERNNTCVPAHPPPYMDTTKCQPYFKEEHGYCTKIIGRRLVYGTIANQKEKEKRLVDFAMAKAALRTLLTFDISKTCVKAVDIIYCNHYFPSCDNTSAVLIPRPVCKEACEVLVKRYCKKEWPKVEEFNKELSVSQFRNQVKYFDLINCTKLPNREGGRIPECFYPREFVEAQERKTKEKQVFTESCYNGDGHLYRGNVSETLSGYPCQSWSSQCPHRHHRTPNNFPELKNAGNACRNPGGQAPHGPWCYTTDPKVRWEYCYVDECEEPVKH